MREIGGYFPYIEEPDNKNHYLDGLCPPEGDLRFLMSGRVPTIWHWRISKNNSPIR